ncbi:MAG: hypothetical protein IJ575_09400 [Selenomonadaceae bacterium]|nr:hypothetical protein [Selenomonadaceae bacterium]
MGLISCAGCAILTTFIAFKVFDYPFHKEGGNFFEYTEMTWIMSIANLSSIYQIRYEENIVILVAIILGGALGGLMLWVFYGIVGIFNENLSKMERKQIAILIIIVLNVLGMIF